jgi:hypothetical protein
MNRRRWPLAALAALALGAAGCGSGGSSDSTTDAVSADSGGTPTLSVQERGVKFAECIRAHGVADFPDPDPTGQFEYGVSVSRDVWVKATTACKSLQPPGTLSSKRNVKQQSAALRFAACVRANGVKDFPDPVNGEPLINTYKIPSSNQPGGMDILNAAVDKCKTRLQAAMGGQK